MMRSLFPLCFLFFAFCSQGQTPSEDAKVRYTAAETNFEKGDYDAVFSDLDEVDRLLKAVTPKSSYLRIRASESRIYGDKFPADWSEIRNLQQRIEHYYNKFTAADPDKRKYVFALSEKLDADFPDRIAFEKLRMTSTTAGATPGKSESTPEASEAAIDFANSLMEKYKFKPFLTRQQFADYNSVAATILNKGDYMQVTSTTYVTYEGSNGGSVEYNHEVKDKPVTGYTYCVIYGRNFHTEVRSEYNKLKNDFIAALGKDDYQLGSGKGYETFSVVTPISGSNNKKLSITLMLFTLDRKDSKVDLIFRVY